MIQNPIFIRNITHLTDARYFAAMEVDWMSIRLTADPASFLLWHTLRDWIAGVKLAAEIPAGDEMLLAKTIIEAKPDGLVLSAPVDPGLPDGIQLFCENRDGLPDHILTDVHAWIISYTPSLTGSKEWPDLNRSNVFFQSEWSADSLRALLQSGYRGGICFSGGDEDITGVRDYEMMDELLEILKAGNS